MSQKSKYWYLEHFNLARRLKRRELMHLCETALMKKYPKNTALVQYADESRSIFFLKKGTLKLTRIQDNGNETLVELIPKGTIFGINQLLSSSYTGNESVVALQNSIVCKVSVHFMKDLMEKNKDLNNHILKLSGLKIKRLENQLENLMFKSAENRIREFVEKFVHEYGVNRGPYFEVEQYLNNKDIGHLASASRQKVNEVLNKMKKEKQIDFDRKTLKWYK